MRDDGVKLRANLWYWCLMLRLTELKLPLDHGEDALRRAVVKRLGVKPEELRGFTVFRRGYDARKKHDIALVYTVDVDVADEAALMRRLAGDRHVAPTPDLAYRPVAQAPATLKLRPV